MRPPTDPLGRRGGRAAVTLALALLTLLSGCTTLAPAPDPAPAPSAPTPPSDPVPSTAPPPAPAPVAVAPAPAPPTRDLADQVARQFAAASERLRALPNAELVREVVRLSEAPASPSTTLEMALGLGLTRNPGDIARAIGILDPIARSSSPDLAPWQPWARLLLARYAEQRRVEDQLERQGQQVRELQRRIDQLGSQVEALKAIERSMAPRPAAPPPGPPPGTRGGTP